MNMLRRIERHLELSGVSATAFGRGVMNDPSFVRQLRNGRQLRPETVARIEAAIDEARRAREAASCRG